MKVLVITQAKGAKINDNLHNVISAAVAINNQCDILIIGDADPTPISYYQCVSKVIHLADISQEQVLASSLARPLSKICKAYTHVLIAADSFGKDLLPRIAGILDNSQISEVIGVISPNTFLRPMYAGNVVAEVESYEELKLLTVRPTSFARYQAVKTDPSPVETIRDIIKADSNTIFVSQEITLSDTVNLAQAPLVVTGGRSLGSKESFDELIHGLALKLGGAVGASRAAVEAGYAANDLQVGQTGKVVAPDLYLAIGISGAVQHIAGMKDSKTVVAINLDPNAQIFEYSDYGLVGDLFEIIPDLIQAL